MRTIRAMTRIAPIPMIIHNRYAGITSCGGGTETVIVVGPGWVMVIGSLVGTAFCSVVKMPVWYCVTAVSGLEALTLQ